MICDNLFKLIVSTTSQAAEPTLFGRLAVECDRNCWLFTPRRLRHFPPGVSNGAASSHRTNGLCAYRNVPRSVTFHGHDDHGIGRGFLECDQIDDVFLWFCG